MTTQFDFAAAQRSAGDQFVIGASGAGHAALWNPRSDPGMLICENSGLGKHTIINQVIAASAFMGRRVILIDHLKYGVEQRELFDSISETAFGDSSSAPLLESLKPEDLDRVTIIYKYAWSTRDVDPEIAARRDREIELLNDLVASKGGSGMLVVATTERAGGIRSRLSEFTSLVIGKPWMTEHAEATAEFTSTENPTPTIATLPDYNPLATRELLTLG